MAGLQGTHRTPGGTLDTENRDQTQEHVLSRLWKELLLRNRSCFCVFPTPSPQLCPWTILESSLWLHFFFHSQQPAIKKVTLFTMTITSDGGFNFHQVPVCPSFISWKRDPLSDFVLPVVGKYFSQCLLCRYLCAEPRLSALLMLTVSPHVLFVHTGSHAPLREISPPNIFILYGLCPRYKMEPSCFSFPQVNFETHPYITFYHLLS